MKIAAEELKSISRLVNDLCGVVLDESKGYLIKSRLSQIAEDTGCKTFSELYYKARYDGNEDLVEKIIDSITTNETLFFRDTSPFDALKHKAVPELIDAKAKTPFPRRLRIWSAACSTGQEPYSIAMVLYELLGDLTEGDIQITATDISDAAISQASIGCYGKLEIQRGMKPELLDKYFITEPNSYKAKDQLRGVIAYSKRNLLEPFSVLGKFDIIFCRNVAIYFEPEVRRDLFNRLADQLTEDGYLFVGSSESLADLGPRFTPEHHCRAVFYRPNRREPAAVA